ncbi:hypothetical protein [Sphingomonas japonica]|nr:hypothetical protein [Sphingomonas japonica]
MQRRPAGYNDIPRGTAHALFTIVGHGWRMGRPGKLAAVLLALAIAACSGAVDGEADGTALAAELAQGQGEDAADPALMAALSDPIMVDPLLSTKANADAIRPPTQPMSGLVPRDDVAVGTSYSGGSLAKAPAALPADRDCPQCTASAAAMTLVALVAGQPGAELPRCAPSMRYSAAWAQALPPAAPLFPDARVIEAAGSDAGGCASRAVSFASATPIATLLDWYYTQASRAGYVAVHHRDGDQHILAARRSGDGATAVVYLNPRDAGSSVDVVTARGL